MKRQEQRWPQEVMLVLARPPVAARGRYSGHIAPTCVCAAAAALQRWWCQMADLGVGLLAPPLPQPPVPIVQISDICTIYVETRGRECPYRPRGGFISMEPILASGTAQETSNFLKRATARTREGRRVVETDRIAKISWST